MDFVFIAFGLYWIIDNFIPEPQLCWHEVKVEEGRLGTNLPCTEENLKTLEASGVVRTEEIQAE